MNEVERLIANTEHKIASDMANMNENLQRKASIDDFNYYRKELGFKLDKSEIETIRQDFLERVTNLDYKLHEKS